MPDPFELQLRADVRRWQQDFRQAAMVLYVQHVAESAEDAGTPDAREIERMSAFTAEIADALHGQTCSIITAQLAGYCRFLKEAGYQDAAAALWARHLPEKDASPAEKLAEMLAQRKAMLGGEPDGA